MKFLLFLVAAMLVLGMSSCSQALCPAYGPGFTKHQRKMWKAEVKLPKKEKTYLAAYYP